MYKSSFRLPFACRAALSGLVLAAGIAIAAPDADAKKAISVTVDQAKLVRIDKPASTVIVGNPSIADATVYDSNTLVITGRSYGTTNLIVLNADGEPIADELLTVAPQQTTTVQIHRRSARFTYSCNPNCAATLSPGDHKAYYDSVKTQLEARHKMSKSSAGGDN